MLVVEMFVCHSRIADTGSCGDDLRAHTIIESRSESSILHARRRSVSTRLR